MVVNDNNKSITGIILIPQFDQFAIRVITSFWYFGPTGKPDTRNRKQHKNTRYTRVYMSI